MYYVLFFIFIINSYAQESFVSRAFIQASAIYQEHDQALENYILKPEIRVILDLFKSRNISPEMLKPYSRLSYPKLISPDKYDLWRLKDSSANHTLFKISIHAYKIDVLDSEDWGGDDIYAYFFVTDGMIPSGKVTSLYSNIDSGQSVFFSSQDRIIYPLGVLGGLSPKNHLIIDYGIIESDGDDIKSLHKLSSIIIDLALAVYASLEPENSSILLKLRREIKTLAELIINLNEDDRILTSSFAYKTEEIDAMMRGKTFIEFKRKHGSKNFFNQWKYQIHFRILRD